MNSLTFAENLIRLLFNLVLLFNIPEPSAPSVTTVRATSSAWPSSTTSTATASSSTTSPATTPSPSSARPKLESLLATKIASKYDLALNCRTNHPYACDSRLRTIALFSECSIKNNLFAFWKKYLPPRSMRNFRRGGLMKTVTNVYLLFDLFVASLN